MGMEHCWIDTNRGKPECWEKNLVTVPLSTTKFLWTGRALNLCLRRVESATISLNLNIGLDGHVAQIATL